MNNNIKKIGKNTALAILSQISIVSAFSKFIEDFVQDNWQERIELWKSEVIKKLSQLDEQMEQKIRETSNVASIIATAQRGALEDMEEDKVSLYANAVINAIKNENINDTKKHIFLNMLRDFSLLHIEVLKNISTSKGPRVVTNSRGIYIENNSLNDLKISFEDTEILEAILKNLSENHLIYNLANKVGTTEPTTITKLGKEFLIFIEEQDTKMINKQVELVDDYNREVNEQITYPIRNVSIVNLYFLNEYYNGDEKFLSFFEKRLQKLEKKNQIFTHDYEITISTLNEIRKSFIVGMFHLWFRELLEFLKEGGYQFHSQKAKFMTSSFNTIANIFKNVIDNNLIKVIKKYSVLTNAMLKLGYI